MSLLKDYFYFSRAERFGIIVLCCLVLLALIIKLSMSYWITPKNYDTEAFADEIAQFNLAVSAKKEKTKTETESEILHLETIVLFYFDPNKASDEEWEKLGLNERQIRNIRNYMASGGSFRKKEDFKKLYTISSTQYQLLEPYIRIGSNRVSNDRVTSNRTTTERQTAVSSLTPRPSPLNSNLLIELNNADSALLTLLPGIGPVLATRTLRYRNLIGGFSNVEQLGEVYGVNRELVESLTGQLSIDSSLIRKIPVNKATLNDLTRHPYINEQQARGILAFRQLQKRIDNIEELIKNNILEPEAAQKIKPYFSFE